MPLRAALAAILALACSSPAWAWGVIVIQVARSPAPPPPPAMMTYYRLVPAAPSMAPAPPAPPAPTEDVSMALVRLRTELQQLKAVAATHTDILAAHDTALRELRQRAAAQK